MKKGVERIPHRALFYALGFTDEELNRPIIGVVNAHNEIIPGHMHLDDIAEAVKAGIRMAGGTPVEFPAIGVCDGIAMNHEGMFYSLPSREHIADSVEIMATAHPFDGLVFIPNCDKIVPGMLMAALRLNIPSIFCSGGPMLPGCVNGSRVALTNAFEAPAAVLSGKMDEATAEAIADGALPRLRLMRRYVHRKLHELHDGNTRSCPGRKRDCPRRRFPQDSTCEAYRHVDNGARQA